MAAPAMESPELSTRRHPLHVAALADDVQTVVALLRQGDSQPLLRGPLPGSRCRDGSEHDVGDKTTVLHATLEVGALRSAQLLVRAAPVLLTMRTRAGFTPALLCCAHARGTDCEALAMLVKAGATLDNVRRKSDGQGPLHLCCAAGCARCAELLLARAPQLIDARDKAGRTALHCAAGCGDARRGCECVTLLLSHGAEPAAAAASLARPIHAASWAGASDSVGRLLHAHAASARARTGLGYGCVALALYGAAARREEARQRRIAGEVRPRDGVLWAMSLRPGSAACPWAVAGSLGRGLGDRACGRADEAGEAFGAEADAGAEWATRDEAVEGEAGCTGPGGAVSESVDSAETSAVWNGADVVETVAILVEAGSQVGVSDLRRMRLGADTQPGRWGAVTGWGADGLAGESRGPQVGGVAADGQRGGAPSLRQLSERALAAQLCPESLVAALGLAEAVGAPLLQAEAERMFVQQYTELQAEGAFEPERTGPGFRGGPVLLRQILARCLARL